MISFIAFFKAVVSLCNTFTHSVAAPFSQLHCFLLVTIRWLKLNLLKKPLNQELLNLKCPYCPTNFHECAFVK